MSHGFPRAPLIRFFRQLTLRARSISCRFPAGSILRDAFGWKYAAEDWDNVIFKKFP
jgi:hypothetical protein